MPRDSDDQEKPAVLTESPDKAHPAEDSPTTEPSNRFVVVGKGQDSSNEPPESRTIRALHPYTRPLTISDLESCIALENAAFDEHERCTPEKVSPFFNCHVPFCFYVQEGYLDRSECCVASASFISVFPCLLLSLFVLFCPSDASSVLSFLYLCGLGFPGKAE
jgi:hypothetical protein